ncbi:MAG TPA: hypothetical protein VF742_17170, partial [Terracidiphilus sp.]
KCLAHMLRNVSEVIEHKTGPDRRFGLKLKVLLRDGLTVSADIKHPQNCRFCRWDRRWTRGRDTRMRRRGTLSNVGLRLGTAR